MRKPKFFEMANVFVISARGHVTGLLRYVFTTIRRQIWQILDPMPPTKC